MSDDWKAGLPEQLKGAAFIKNAESLDQAVADIANAAAWRGNSIRIPGPDTDAAQLAEFRAKAMEKIPGLVAVPEPDTEDYAPFLQKLGMPATAEKYKVGADIDIAPDALGTLKATAHEMGMTQHQFDKWIGQQYSATKTATEQAQAAVKEQQAIVQKEWGAATESRMADIGDYLASDPTVPADMVAAFKEGRLSAEYVRYLYSQTQRLAEGGEIARQVNASDAITPLEAHERFFELTERLLTMTPTDPRYKELVQKRAGLAGLMKPG